MHLASDYVHPLPGRGRCRVRIYFPEAEDELLYDDAPVVVCSEVAGNAGPSVTEQAERVAAEVMIHHRMDRAPMWIEHWPPDTTDGRAETFELVVFSHHEVREIASAEGEEVRPEIGRPAAWKGLDRGTVERLLGQEV